MGVMEVDVGNQGKGNGLFDFTQGGSRLRIRHGHPDDLAARFFEGVNLGDRLRNVPRIRAGHGLNGNRRSPADLDLSNAECSGILSLK